MSDDMPDELEQAEAAIEADAERNARTAEHDARMRRSTEDLAAGEDRQDPLRARKVDRNDAEEAPTEQHLEDSDAYERMRAPDAAGYREDITGQRRNQTRGALQQMLAQIAMPVHVERHPEHGWQVISREGVVAEVASEDVARFLADALNAAAEETSEPDLLPADEFLHDVQELLDAVTENIRQRRRRLARTRQEAGSRRGQP